MECTNRSWTRHCTVRFYSGIFSVLYLRREKSAKYSSSMLPNTAYSSLLQITGSFIVTLQFFPSPLIATIEFTTRLHKAVQLLWCKTLTVLRYKTLTVYPRWPLLQTKLIV